MTITQCKSFDPAIIIPAAPKVSVGFLGGLSSATGVMASSVGRVVSRCRLCFLGWLPCAAGVVASNVGRLRPGGNMTINQCKSFDPDIINQTSPNVSVGFLRGLPSATGVVASSVGRVGSRCRLCLLGGLPSATGVVASSAGRLRPRFRLGFWEGCRVQQG